MSFNNNLGIKYDAKFVRLVNRLLYEHAQVRSSDQAMSNLSNSNLLSRNLSDILSNKNKEMKEQSETTLKHIFKYIDRRVERAVLEERNAQEVGMTISADGMCRINVRNRNTSDYDIITRFLYKEIAKINPSVLLINDKYIDYEQTLCDLALGVKERSIYIVFGFGDSRIDLSFRSTNMWVEINLPEIAKYFSDEVNKIARDKYEPNKPKTLIDDKDRGIDSAWMARQMKILGSILDRDDR